MGEEKEEEGNMWCGKRALREKLGRILYDLLLVHDSDSEYSGPPPPVRHPFLVKLTKIGEVSPEAHTTCAGRPGSRRGFLILELSAYWTLLLLL